MVFSNQRTQSAVSACGSVGRWESVAWLGLAGITKGLSVGVTKQVMGWGGTVTPAQKQEVRREGREGDEAAGSRNGEEAYAGGGGTGTQEGRRMSFCKQECMIGSNHTVTFIK